MKSFENSEYCKMHFNFHNPVVIENVERCTVIFHSGIRCNSRHIYKNEELSFCKMHFTIKRNNYNHI